MFPLSASSPVEGPCQAVDFELEMVGQTSISQKAFISRVYHSLSCMPRAVSQSVSSLCLRVILGVGIRSNLTSACMLVNVCDIDHNSLLLNHR